MPANYDDDMAVDPAVNPEGTADGGEDETESTEEEDSPQSFLLDKAAFGDKVQPGDTLTVKVVEVYEDDVEVKPVAEEAPAETPPEPGMRERVGQRMQDRMATMTS